MRKYINPLLVVLILLDVAYVVVIFVSPSAWFRGIHGTRYVDPEGLLRRLGAVWGSFAVFQAVALARWQRQPHWLMFVAGIRSTEVVADWVYVWFAHDKTLIGYLGLLAASPINIFCTWFFYAAYLAVTQRQGLVVGQVAGEPATPSKPPPGGAST